MAGLVGVGSVPTNTAESQTTSLKTSRQPSKEEDREEFPKRDTTALKLSVFQQYTLKGEQMSELEYSP